MALVHLSKRAPRRPTPPSYIVISGEYITNADAAKRMDMTAEQWSTRKRQVLRYLKGQPLTWEALIKNSPT